MAWSAAVASTVLWATIRAGDDRSRDDRLRTHPLVDGALLVRPCAGAEASLGRALGSTSAAVRSFPIRVRFALASREDAALAEAARAADRLNAEGTDASVVVSGAIAPNRKADQLARTLANELDPPSIVIVADSDVDLSGVSLDALVRPLDDPRVAAAWAAPVEVAPTTIGDRASAAVLDASLHSFGLLAALDRNGMVGKLFAVRRDALEHVGGFGAMVEHLGEDMELARRLRAAGWRTELAAVLAPSLAAGRSWSDAAARYARWIAVIRSQRPQLLVSYPALLVPTAPLLLASLSAVAFGGALGWAACGLALLARIGAACMARSHAGLPLRASSLVVDAALSDALLLHAFVRALASRRTVWRGVELRRGPSGRFREEAR
jgi:ceramide glucosyltransferase